MLPFIPIGSYQVSTYFLLHAILFLVLGLWVYHRLLGVSENPNTVLLGVGITLASAVVGSVIAYKVVDVTIGWINPGQRPGNGSTILGAIIGAIVSGLIYSHMRRQPTGRAFDAGVLPIPLGQAIGRIGCLLSGCCYGIPTQSWLGINLPDADGHWCNRYPTQIVSAFSDLVIFTVLVVVERWQHRTSARVSPRPFAGFLALLYLTLYLTKRMLIEFIRDEPKILGLFSWAQAVAAVGLGIVVILMIHNFRHHQPAGSSPEMADNTSMGQQPILR